MTLAIATFTLIVDDYDRGIAYFRDVLGLTLAEDTPLGGGKRWVVMGGAGGACMLLAQADGDIGRRIHAPAFCEAASLGKVVDVIRAPHG